MRAIFGLVLILGLALAGGAVYMAKDYLSQTQAQLEQERELRDQIVPTKEVIVANRQIRYGEWLAPEDLRKVKWPEQAVPAGAFTSVDELFPQGFEEPRAVLRTMEKDEAVLAVKVTDPGEDAGVSSRLSPGMRAFAIRVDVTSGVSGFLRPGDRVDVYWSGSVGREEVTKLIDANVKLVAIDQSADEDRSSPTVARTVTVEASPRQVASLAQAQETGRLSLSLVGAEDQGTADMVEINQRELLGLKEEKVVEVEREEVCTIKTRKGGEVHEIAIPCTN
ncbi:Flp pilus assembly protein CpaB [Tranquillimonas alkanivorans]|uniref:Pilus assembly protein CpaB n=1 Tax=Tranquillimonas alkanivorans TaxID=441119 RepID=A0A1I5M9G3_9RHOB|nr:Flp pilus assembly protein CpaB [Tranquillimonas alkanivorans]SFP06179.1 pilus assembly protein CpaB [Tranquillimonas alkanivorans]